MGPFVVVLDSVSHAVYTFAGSSWYSSALVVGLVCVGGGGVRRSCWWRGRSSFVLVALVLVAFVVRAGALVLVAFVVRAGALVLVAFVVRTGGVGAGGVCRSCWCRCVGSVGAGGVRAGGVRAAAVRAPVVVLVPLVPVHSYLCVRAGVFVLVVLVLAVLTLVVFVLVPFVLVVSCRWCSCCAVVVAMAHLSCSTS